MAAARRCSRALMRIANPYEPVRGNAMDCTGQRWIPLGPLLGQQVAWVCQQREQRAGLIITDRTIRETSVLHVCLSLLPAPASFWSGHVIDTAGLHTIVTNTSVA